MGAVVMKNSLQEFTRFTVHLINGVQRQAAANPRTKTTASPTPPSPFIMHQQQSIRYR